jgi:hypothetical protein
MNPYSNSDCKDCQKGIFDKPFKLISVSVFFATTSVYGLVSIINDIIDYLNH